MAKKQTTAAEIAAQQTETLSALPLHETMKIPGWDVTRVPGGFIYARGTVTQYVPLTELAAGEIGLKLEDA